MVNNDVTRDDAYDYMKMEYTGKSGITVSQAFLDLSKNGLSGLLSEVSIRKKLDEIGCRANSIGGRGPIKDSYTKFTAATTQKSSGKRAKKLGNFALSG